MKNVIISMCLIFMLIISMSIVMTLDGRAVRSNEAEKSLKNALVSTLDNLMNKKAYSIDGKDELIADLLENLLVQIESTSTIEINVLDVDSKRGLLSIEVIERFQHPNGFNSSVSALQTVIFEPDSEKDDSGMEYFVTITYLLPDDIVYKKYSVTKDSELIIPRNPVIEGKTFLHWEENGVMFALTDTYNHRVKIDRNVTLTAVFK